MSHSHIRRLNIKVSNPSRLTYQLNTNSVNILIFWEIDKLILNPMWKCKGPGIAKITLNEQRWKIYVTLLKDYNKGYEKIVLALTGFI